MLTPNGRVVLLDFELASAPDDHAHPGLAAPGFNRAARIPGPDGDWEALLILWLYLLFPLTDIIDRDPDKFGVLLEAALPYFPGAQQELPEELAARLPQHPGRSQGHPERYFKEDASRGEAREAICAGIQASASLERSDRLFPADPNVFRYGGHTLAYGAAGVLWTLHRCGLPVPDSYVDWLARSALVHRTGGLGLYNGRYGAAVVLDTIGRRQDALGVLTAARSARQPVSPGLFGGRAGVGLALLHFAEVLGDDELHATAISMADDIADELRAGRFEQRDTSLMHGMSGAALLFLHTYRCTCAERYLDLALAALRADLNRCVNARGDALMVLDDHRHVPTFEHGSAGIAVVAHEYLRWREDDRLRADLDRLLRACVVPFTRESGLFRGRAGLVVALAMTGDAAAAAAHTARFTWHAMPFNGHPAFPGSHLRRLSMDLATGSAGVLLALLAASGVSHVLPFTDTRCSVAESSTLVTERR